MKEHVASVLRVGTGNQGRSPCGTVCDELEAKLLLKHLGTVHVVSAEAEDRGCEWKRGGISESLVFLGLTGNSACWFLHKTTPLCRVGAISSGFYPPFLESGFEVAAPRFESERERALPLEISENRPLYFSLPLCGYGRGKMDWSRERRESARQRDQCPAAAQRARKK